MISGSAIEFIEDTLNQLRVGENRNQILIARIVEAEQKTKDAEAKLDAAQNNLLATQKKLYAACEILIEVFRDYRDLNFKTKASRKRADKMLDKMRNFRKEHDIHIEQTEKGWVAK